ncbi:MAG: YhcH/YjgK/YiaL family protein [Clostridia bacterium]|nr:YhcH/YjgK/YiaL family protein [Clostridia bacterium]
MIITDLNSPELTLYAKTNDSFAQIFEIAKAALNSIPEDGKYALDGDKVYYSVQSYDTKPASEAKFETHEKYIDIQVILDGEEIIRFDTVDKLNVTVEYDKTRDCAFYAMNDEYDTVRLRRGELAIIFPNEAHAPCVAPNDTPAPVHKMVAKILY